ncbi:hypothetical protein [Paraburkholderia sp. ZP32-5]|uniref:hypothetical protein n=1 Tax=Paraburkholderia sp. ZP32-5 TaxID=2883245 RepID=UPI001F1B63D7|nr:hypothetical protein [Paraburkholderia sp. ZP32-5]
MLYLNAAHIDELELDCNDIESAVRATLLQLHDGTTIAPPRVVMQTAASARFIAFPALLAARGIAGVKWLSLRAGAAPGEAAQTSALLLLGNATTGALEAIMDARWITLMRTVAVSLIAARTLADPHSRRVAFIGCGMQARAHAKWLARAFPLSRATVYSRREATARDFASELTAPGIESAVAASATACVADADIVVSSASTSSPNGLRCDPRALSEGSFVSLVDLGRSFDWTAANGFATFAVDDPAQYEALARDKHLPLYTGGAPQSLTALIDARQRDSTIRFAGPAALMPTGLGAADLALAALLREKALKQGVGLSLPDSVC